ncbi:ribosome maturation factor RimP [Rhodococcus rhodnii]|uniref:Ribosome maturation factor RimP n=2 Tax=Rhodococcus rhodnii TaxID=38312 RepID=R7WL59_9NOCA|nr:ribosome maturation factor RimP [Rhodococcus rhodnii]EOM76037.1 hypothetical protein Rrhod_2685 [Rhodococcus rhodnii LMG 5362]TXG90870.1 ribosome maturation factor RimP [Rhodococcus rhodnii]
MPVPSKERISELVADVVARHGYDLEDVVVTLAGKHSAVRILVDGDAGLGLDDVAGLSREISAVFDSVSDFGESPYTLEVTSPGIDRPLTHERHWRRARGRRARITLPDEVLLARVGRLGDDGTVEVVLPGRPQPQVRRIALDDVTTAVVEVEFRTPDARELELAGGLPDGRAAAGEIDELTETGEFTEEEEEGPDK